MRSVELIRELIEPELEQQGFFLVDVVLRGERGNQVLEVFIDTDAGVTTDECAEASRSISALLDRNNVLDGKYVLIVSSPGLDRPLVLPRQYKKNLGRKLRIVLMEQSQRKILEGELLASSEGEIVLTTESEGSVTIPMLSIIEAKVCLPW